MDKKTIAFIAIFIVAACALIGISVAQNHANKTDYSDYAPQQIYEPSEITGNFEENIQGNPDAPVIIYEYGDYQCTACAPMNPYINKLSEEYGDKIAIVFRTTIMSYHQNGTAAAAAANAAARQGYWEDYKNLLYTNQNDWYYSDATTRQNQFEEYFVRVSSGKGDLAQFRADMASKENQAKIDFDEAMAKKIGTSFTPYFLVEDQWVDQREKSLDDFLDEMRAAIDAKLEEKGISKK